MTCKQDRQRMRDCMTNSLTLIQDRYRSHPTTGFRLAGPGVEAELFTIAAAMTDEVMEWEVITDAGFAVWLHDQLAMMFETGAEFARRGHYPEVSPTCSCED